MVKPLFEEGDRSQISNYRLVTLVSNITEMIEKLILVRRRFYYKKSIIVKEPVWISQEYVNRGYYKKVTNIIYNNIENAILSLTVMLDLSKAFDIVSYDRLLERLNSYRFR